MTLKNRLLAKNTKTIAKSEVVDINEYRKSRVQSDFTNVILLTSDEQISASISRVLGSRGIRVESTLDVICFSKTFQLRVFDIIIIYDEHQLLSGGELSSIIKAYKEYSEIPLIILSERDSDHLETRHGLFDAVLKKPVNALQLLSVVNIFLDRMNKSIDTK